MPKPKKNNGTSSKTGNGKQKGGTNSPNREIVYPNIEVGIHIGDEAITLAKAKNLLGWVEENEKDQFKDDYLLKVNKVKVRCTNNVTNRPFYAAQADTLKQEHLRRRWRFNGEPIIIGATGLILNGQHTLVSFVLAVDEWEQHPDRWPAWESAPVLEKLVVYGVAEDDETVNTMDTCKPRSLMDVIYRANYFKDLPSKAHRVASRMLQFAINQMWDRTGVHANPHAARNTHSESIAFLEHHQKLLAAVKHVYEEDNNENRIGKYLSAGYASAALYLMGCCKTEPKNYFLAQDQTLDESTLDWTYWERACEFFVELAGGSKTVKAVHDAIQKLIESGAGSKDERWAIIAKAWEAYKDKKPITAKTVHLDFQMKDNIRQLAEMPLFGGIDVGAEGVPFDDPSEEELEQRKEEVDVKRNGPKKEAKRAGDKWAKNDLGWVHNEFEEVELVRLKGDPYICQGDKVERVMVDASDGEYEVAVDNLSLAQFEMK